ncbi:MAG TPA: isoprenylcysteine carboxylmethyltransferase family protein [Saprospiraceae bacterium]|nr:isoprenylcysteine carboxylmethyltransferase family protein [Saprospiraceae bacterium]
MTSLFLRNLFYTIIQPGIVAGLVPYMLVRDRLSEVLSSPLKFYQLVALLLIAVGLVLLLSSVFDFSRYGEGTLSPLDPTKKLVIRGFYRFSRNPMYLAVLLILLGETIFVRSRHLGIYMVFVAIAFLIFVVFFEEPRLQRKFGTEYSDYKGSVRRWL